VKKMSSTSASSSSAGAQQKFSNIRRRLDQLGYRQPLGIESLPLVEKLLTDLVHTTESLKRARLGRTLGDGGSASGDAGSHVLTDAQIDAYKSDNARLIRENNELHQQLLHNKEELEFSIKGFIHFQKLFHSICRTVLWIMTYSY
jgi:centrosomal protein CEP135